MAYSTDLRKRILELIKAGGKKIVYVDECGFRAESYRSNSYGPKGECVLGLISDRLNTTLQISNALENTIQIKPLMKL